MMTKTIEVKPSQPTDRTRREFLKTTTTAATGLGLAAGLTVPRLAHGDGDGGETIRLGLIGCGGRGSGAVIDASRAEPNLQLVALADVFDDRLQSARNRFAKVGSHMEVPDDMCFVGFDAFEKVLAADIDVVILATPPHFRPQHFQAAVEAGKHVFMEKPVAVDAPGVRKVLAAGEQARERGLCVGVGLQRHHQHHYREAVKRLQDGAIGEIILSRVYWNSGGVWVHPREELEKEYGRKLTEMEYQMRNWYYFTWLCGDHIVEQHIHNLDVANWVKGGYPVEAVGMGGRQVRTGKEYGQIFDHHDVEFTFQDGSKLLSQCRHIPSCWNSVSEHFHGTKGTARLSGDDPSWSRIESDSTWRYEGPTPSPYRVEHEDLIAAIRSSTPYNEAENGAKSTMTAIFGRMATYSGKQLRWDEALASSIDLSLPEYSFDSTPPVVPDAEGYYPVPIPGVTQVV